MASLTFTPLKFSCKTPTAMPVSSRRPSLRPCRVFCHKTEPEKLPPGPPQLPLIGNLHNLVSGSLPHKTLCSLASEHGPLMHLKLGERSTLIVSSATVAQEVMKTNDHIFSERAECLLSKIVAYDSTDILFSNGEYWKQMKKLCTAELLTAKKVKSFAGVREDEVSKLIESVRLAGDWPINLTEKIFWMTSVIACRSAFGNRVDEQKHIITIANEIVHLAVGFDLAELYPSLKFLELFSPTKHKLEKLHKEMDEIFSRFVEERKKELANGNGIAEDEVLMDVLLRFQGSRQLHCPVTNDNIKAIITDMFVAGTDTSSTASEWAMSELIKNPRVMKKAQYEIREALRGKTTICEEDIKDLEYLPLVIKETLRLHPPVPLLLPRESTEKCRINGYEIPEKTRVIVNAYAIGRDPDYWEDPLSFIPERFINNSADYVGSDFKFLPFGAGRRICPGITLGLANIELPVASLLYHFDWKLPDGMPLEELEMTEAYGAAIGRKNNLRLIATPYKPSN